MKSKVQPARLLFKVLIVLVVLDLSYAFWRPPVGRLSVYNWLVPGRTRFPYGNSTLPNNGSYNVAVYEDFNSMFASHVISGGSKPAGEYRVIVLGDSSIWGLGIHAGDTVVEQINRLNLTTCQGRAVRAYNLAVPASVAFRDILLLQQSKAYQPDLFIWFVTLNSFLDRPGEAAFAHAQPDLSLALVKKYHLAMDLGGTRPSSVLDGTILGQRVLVKKVILNQLYGLLWSATGVDFVEGAVQGSRVQLAADSSLPDFNSITDRQGLLVAMDFEVLAAGQAEAGETSLLVVNEPINRVSGKNSDVRYNRSYPRWAYDDYRFALAEWMASHRLAYLDVWDILPESEFFPSSSLHALPEGEQRLAGRLAPDILEMACP